MKLKILDLFSGLGGFSLGLERTGNFETIAFCDNDRYSNLVLQKHWKGVKVYNDVKEITKERLESDGVEPPNTNPAFCVPAPPSPDLAVIADPPVVQEAPSYSWVSVVRALENPRAATAAF